MLAALSNRALEADLRAEILSAHPNVDIAPTTLQAGLAQPAITGKYSAGEIAAAQAETENAAIHHHWELWLRQDTYFFEHDGNPHQVHHRRRLRVVGSPIGRQLVCVRPTGQGYSTGALPAALIPGGTVTLIRPANAGLGGDFGTLTLNASRFDDQGNRVTALDAVPQLRSLNPNILARVVRSSPGFAEVALRPETAAAEFTGFLRGEALLEFSNSHSERIVVLLGVPNPPDPARPDAGPAPAVDECLAVPSPCVPNSQCADTNTAAVGGVVCGACNPGYEANDNGECVSPVVRPVVPEGINVQGPVLPRVGLDTARAACVQLGGDYVETSEARRDSYASLEDLPYELRGWLAGGRDYLRGRFGVSGGNSDANELDALALYWINSDNPNLTLIARSIGYSEEAEFNLRDTFLDAAYGPLHGDGWRDIFVDQGRRWAVAVTDLNNLTAGPFQVPSCLNLESENPGSVADLTDEEGLDLLDQARDCALQGKRLAEDGRCEEESCGEGEVLRGGRCQAETAPEPLPDQVEPIGNPVPDPENEEQQSDVCTALGGTWTNDDKCVGLEADNPDGEADPTTSEGVTVFIQARDCALQGRRLNSNGECEEQTCPAGQVLQYGRCVSDNPPPPLPEGVPITGNVTVVDASSEAGCALLGGGWTPPDKCANIPYSVNSPNSTIRALCEAFGGEWSSETCSLAAKSENQPFTCNSAETCADAFNLVRSCALQGRPVAKFADGGRCVQDELCPPNQVIREGECQLVEPPPIPEPEDILPPPVLPDGTANPALFSLFNPEDEQKCIDAGGEIWEMTQDDTGIRGRLCVGYPPDRQSQSVCSSLESPAARQNPNSRFRDQFGSTFPLRIGGRSWESFFDLSSCHDGAYTCGDVREFEPDSVPTVNHDNNPLTPCLEIREPVTCEVNYAYPDDVQNFVDLLESVILQFRGLFRRETDRIQSVVNAVSVKFNGGANYNDIIADVEVGGANYTWFAYNLAIQQATIALPGSYDFGTARNPNAGELFRILAYIPVVQPGVTPTELDKLGDLEPPPEDGETDDERTAREARNVERNLVRHRLANCDTNMPARPELPRVNRGGPSQIGFVSSRRLFNVRDVRPLSIVPVVTISAQIRQLESAAIETGDSLDDYAEEWEVERHDTIIEYLGVDWSGAATPHAFEVRPLAGAPTALQDWEIVTRPPEIVEGGAQSRALYLDQFGGDNTRMHPVTEVELGDGSVSLAADLFNYWHFSRNQNGLDRVSAEHRAREAQAGCVPVSEGAYQYDSSTYSGGVYSCVECLDYPFYCAKFAKAGESVRISGEFYGVDAEGNVVQVDDSSAVRQVQLPEGYFNDRLFEPYGENRNLGNPNAGLNGERACLPVALARERYRGRAGEDLVVNPEWPTQLLVNPQTGRRAQPGDAGAETYNVVYCPPPVRLGKFVFLVKNNYYQEEEFCRDTGSGRSSGRSPAASWSQCPDYAGGAPQSPIRGLFLLTITVSVNLLRENADFDETKHIRLNSRDEFYPQRAPAGFSSGMHAVPATLGGATVIGERPVFQRAVPEWASPVTVPTYPVAAWPANFMGADSVYRYEFGKIPPGYGVTLVPALAMMGHPGFPANLANLADHLSRNIDLFHDPVSLYAIYRNTPLGENEFDSDILRVRVYGSHQGAESLLGVMPLNLRMRAFSPPEAINAAPVTLSRVDARIVNTVTVTVYQSKRVTLANSTINAIATGTLTVTQTVDHAGLVEDYPLASGKALSADSAFKPGPMVANFEPALRAFSRESVNSPHLRFRYLGVADAYGAVNASGKSSGLGGLFGQNGKGIVAFRVPRDADNHPIWGAQASINVNMGGVHYIVGEYTDPLHFLGAVTVSARVELVPYGDSAETLAADVTYSAVVVDGYKGDLMTYYPQAVSGYPTDAKARIPGGAAVQYRTINGERVRAADVDGTGLILEEAARVVELCVNSGEGFCDEGEALTDSGIVMVERDGNLVFQTRGKLDFPALVGREDLRGGAQAAGGNYSGFLNHSFVVEEVDGAGNVRERTVNLKLYVISGESRWLPPLADTDAHPGMTLALLGRKQNGGLRLPRFERFLNLVNAAGGNVDVTPGQFSLDSVSGAARGRVESVRGEMWLVLDQQLPAGGQVVQGGYEHPALIGRLPFVAHFEVLRTRTAAAGLLVSAVVSGDEDEVRRVLDLGVDGDDLSPEGDTGLHAAVRRFADGGGAKNIRLVWMMAESGADPWTLDASGLAPMHVALSVAGAGGSEDAVAALMLAPFEEPDYSEILYEIETSSYVFLPNPNPNGAIPNYIQPPIADNYGWREVLPAAVERLRSSSTTAPVSLTYADDISASHYIRPRVYGLGPQTCPVQGRGIMDAEWSAAGASQTGKLQLTVHACERRRRIPLVGGARVVGAHNGNPADATTVDGQTTPLTYAVKRWQTASSVDKPHWARGIARLARFAEKNDFCTWQNTADEVAACFAARVGRLAQLIRDDDQSAFDQLLGTRVGAVGSVALITITAPVSVLAAPFPSTTYINNPDPRNVTLTTWVPGYVTVVNGVTATVLGSDLNLNERDANGRTPLHNAVFRDNTHFVTVLLLFNADVNVEDNNGASPMHLAISLRKAHVVSLLARGVSREFDGQTFLHATNYRPHGSHLVEDGVLYRPLSYAGLLYATENNAGAQGVLEEIAVHLNHPGDPCYESGDSPDGANILTCAGGGRQADGGLNTRKLFALVAADDKAGVAAFFADNNLANGDGSAARNIYMPDQYNRRHPTIVGGIIPETGNLVHYAAQIGAPRVMEFLLTVLAANSSKIFEVNYQRTRESDAVANQGETALMWAFTHWQHGFAATIVRQLHEAGADLEIFDNTQSPRMRALDIGITLYVQESGRYIFEDSPQAGPIPPALQGLGQAIIYLNTAAPGNCTTTASQKGPCVLPADLTGESVLAQVVLEKYLVGGSVVASVAGQALENGGFVDGAALVTFTALPDAGAVITMWTGDCASVAIAAPAGPATCVQTAGSGLRVGALFAGKQFDFAGNPVYAVGEVVAAGADASTMVAYYGTRRGLWLMRSQDDMTGAKALALCDNAGAAGNGQNWRLPNLREAVGIFFNGDDPQEVRVSGDVPNGYYGIDTAANVQPPRPEEPGDAIPLVDDNINGSLFPSFYTKGTVFLPLIEGGSDNAIFENAVMDARAVCVAPISDEYGEVDPYAGPELTPDAADAGEVEGPATAVYTLTAQLRHNGPYSASIRADARVAVDVLTPAGYVDNPFSLQTEEEGGPGELQVELLARGPTQNEMLNGLTGEYVATIRAYQPGVSDSSTVFAEITVAMVRERLEGQIFTIIHNSGRESSGASDQIRFTEANARAVRRLLERGAETRYLTVAHALDAEPPNDRSLMVYAARTYASINPDFSETYCEDWQPWATAVSVFFQHGAHPNDKYRQPARSGVSSLNFLHHLNGHNGICRQGGPEILRAYLTGVQEHYPDILIEDLINEDQGDFLADRFARNALEWMSRAPNLRSITYPALRDMSALLYERGGRCRYTFSGKKKGQGETDQHSNLFFEYVEFCLVPEEDVAVENLPSERTGDLISVQARDFAGVLFDFERPAAAELETLGRNGWGLAINTDSRPHSAVLSRVREFRQGDENILLTMIARRADNGETVRNYIVRGEFAPGGPVGFDSAGGAGVIDAVNHNGVTLVNALTAIFETDPDDSNVTLTTYADSRVNVPGGAIVTFRARPDRGFYLREWGGVCAGEPGGQDESESQVLVKEIGRHSALATGEGRVCVVEVRTGITVTAIWDASSIGPEVRGYADGAFGDVRVTSIGQILPLVETALTQTLDYVQYYGVRRGLHWLITEPGRFPASQQDETCGNVRIAGACRYRAQAVCDRAGPNWRTPDFSEVAGLLESAGNTYTFPAVTYSAQLASDLTATISAADYFPEYGWQAEKTVDLWNLTGTDITAFSGTVAFFGTYSKDGFGARVLPFAADLGEVQDDKLIEGVLPKLIIRDSHFACVAQAPGYNRSIASPDRAALRMRVVLSEDNAPVALTANLFAGAGALTARVEAWRYDINGNETRLNIPLTVGEISGGGSAAQNYGRSVRVMPDGLVEIVVSQIDPNDTPVSDVRFEIVVGTSGDKLSPRLTLKISAKPPARFAFGEQSFNRIGDVVQVRAKNIFEDARRGSDPVRVNMEYKGVRRGLHMMVMRDTDSGAETLGDGYQESVCQAAAGDSGEAWRLPRLGELMGLIAGGDDQAEVSITYDVQHQRKTTPHTYRGILGFDAGGRVKIRGELIPGARQGRTVTDTSDNTYTLEAPGDKITFGAMVSNTDAPGLPLALDAESNVPKGIAVTTAAYYADVYSDGVVTDADGQQYNSSIPFMKRALTDGSGSHMVDILRPKSQEGNASTPKTPQPSAAGKIVCVRPDSGSYKAPPRLVMMDIFSDALSYARLYGEDAPLNNYFADNPTTINRYGDFSFRGVRYQRVIPADQPQPPRGIFMSQEGYGENDPNLVAGGGAGVQLKRGDLPSQGHSFVLEGSGDSRRLTDQLIPANCGSSSDRLSGCRLGYDFVEEDTLESYELARAVGASNVSQTIRIAGQNVVADILPFHMIAPAEADPFVVDPGFPNVRIQDADPAFASNPPDAGVIYPATIVLRPHSGGPVALPINLRYLPAAATGSTILATIRAAPGANGQVRGTLFVSNLKQEFFSRPQSQSQSSLAAGPLYSPVEALAIPDAGYYVSGWTGVCDADPGVVPMTDPLVIRSETGTLADPAPKRCVFVPHTAGTYDVSPTFAAIDYDEVLRSEIRNFDREPWDADLIEDLLTTHEVDAATLQVKRDPDSSLFTLFEYIGTHLDDYFKNLGSQLSPDNEGRVMRLLAHHGAPLDAGSGDYDADYALAGLLEYGANNPRHFPVVNAMVRGIFAGMASGRPSEDLQSVLQRDGDHTERHYMNNVLKMCSKTGAAECWELARILRDYAGPRCNAKDQDAHTDVCAGNIRLVVQAGSGTGDVHQIVGRYPEMLGFSYEVSGGGDKQAALSAAGWTVFVQTAADGPDRIVFSRTRAADASTPDVQVTVQADYVGTPARIYHVELLGGGGQAYLNQALFDHLHPVNQVSPSYVRDLLRQGADPNYAKNGVPLLLMLIDDISRTYAISHRDRVFTYDSRAEIMGMLIDAGARPDAVRISAPGESQSVAFRPENTPVLDGLSVPHQIANLMDYEAIGDAYYSQNSAGLIAVYREYLAAIARNSAARRISAPFNGLAFWQNPHSLDFDSVHIFPAAYHTPLDMLAHACRRPENYVSDATREAACKELFVSFLERGATCSYLASATAFTVVVREKRYCSQSAVEDNVEQVTVYYAREDQGVIWEYTAPSAETELLFLDYPSDLATRRKLESSGWRMTVDSSSGVDRFELSLPVVSGASIVESPNATLIVALNGRPTRKIALNVVEGGAADRAVRISQSPGGTVAAQVSYPTYAVIADGVTTTLDARSTVVSDGKLFRVVLIKNGEFLEASVSDLENNDRTWTSGTRVTFAAIPDSGYYVAGWTGSCAAPNVSQDEFAEVGADDAASLGRTKICSLAGQRNLRVAAVFRRSSAGLGAAAARLSLSSVSLSANGELRWTDAFGADSAPQAGDVLDLRWDGSAVARLSGADSSASFVLNDLDDVEMRGDSNLGLNRIGRVLALNSGGLSLDGGGWAKVVSHGGSSEINLSSGAGLTMEADSSGALRRFALFSGRVDVSDDADGAPATLRCDDQEQRASGGGYFTECAGDVSVQPPSAGQIRISYATPSRRAADTLLPSSSAAEAPLPVSGVEVALSGGDNEPIVLQVRGAAGAAATRLTVNPGLSDLRNVNFVIYPGPIVQVANADARVEISHNGESGELDCDAGVDVSKTIGGAQIHCPVNQCAAGANPCSGANVQCVELNENSYETVEQLCQCDQGYGPGETPGTCVEQSDQCAILNPCDVNGACNDPDEDATNSNAQLCTCNFGYFSADGGLTCQKEVDQCHYAGICGDANCSDPDLQAHNSADALCSYPDGRDYVVPDVLPAFDQCQDNPCHLGADCSDPDQTADNTVAALCACRAADGYSGDGAACAAPDVAPGRVNPLMGTDVSLVVSPLYTGAVATLTSTHRLLRRDAYSTPSGELFLDGRSGVVRVTRPLTKAVRDYFAIDYGRRAPATVSISITPIERLVFSYDRASGAAFADVNLNSGLLSGATFSPARFGGAAQTSFPIADYSISREGVLRKTGNVAEGAVTVGFSAVGAGFRGTLDGEVYLRGNPAAPSGLKFGDDNPINLRGDVVVAAAANSLNESLSVTYWGRRRGLHYALVKIGETPDLGGTSQQVFSFPESGVEFEAEWMENAGGDVDCVNNVCKGNFDENVLEILRRNLYSETPGQGYVYRNDNGDLVRLTARKPRARPDQRVSSPNGWTMADYNALCNRASGLGAGRTWRAPSIGEAAALAHQHVSVIVGGSHNKLTQHVDINGAPTPITFNALTVNADTVPLLRREFPIGVPGLVPSRLSPPLVQLPAADGLDTRGPVLDGGMIAVNNGVPAGYVDNQPGEWSGRMWALGVASGGGVGQFSAFTPQQEGVFKGATGYAACVAEAAPASYQAPPELSVLEFSYAGKSVRCPLNAIPSSALCSESGHPEFPDIADSALMDESQARFEMDADNVVATLTLKAWRFGDRDDGSADLTRISGEVERAVWHVTATSHYPVRLDEKIELVNGTVTTTLSWAVPGSDILPMGMTLIEVSSNANESVYKLSMTLRLPAGATPTLKAVVSANPRVGRGALLDIEFVPSGVAAPELGLDDYASVPPPLPERAVKQGFELVGAATVVVEGAQRRDLWIGAGYSGAILTITSRMSGKNLSIRVIGGDPALGVSAPMINGGRVVSLISQLPTFDNWDSPQAHVYPNSARARYQHAPLGNEARVTLGITPAGESEFVLELVANPLSSPPLQHIELDSDVGPGGVVMDLLAESRDGGGIWGRGGFWGFPQLFFDPRHAGVEFTDADGADTLIFGRRGVVRAVTSLCGVLKNLDTGKDACLWRNHYGKGVVDSPFLRQVPVNVRADIGRQIPVKKNYDAFRVTNTVGLAGALSWYDLRFTGYIRPDSSTVIVLAKVATIIVSTLYNESNVSIGVSVTVVPEPSTTTTVTVHSPMTWGIVFPEEADLPDFSAAGLSVDISRDGISVFVPESNPMALGERRTLAFNIPVYEQDVAGCSDTDDLKSFFDCDRSGPKNVRFFWDVRIVVGGYREFFGAFVGEAPINGLLPPVPEGEGAFFLPVSGEEFSLGELIWLFGNAGLPKNIPVAEGLESSWSVHGGAANQIGDRGQSWTPGRLVGADGAVSERLTSSGETRLPLAPGVDALLDLSANDIDSDATPDIFVRVSVNSQNIDYPARGRFHLTLYSRPEQISLRVAPEAIVHFYYDIAAPGRTRVQNPSVRTEIGPWEFNTSDVPPTAGSVFMGDPGQEIDPPPGHILEWLAGYHVTVYVDNTGGRPTFQFGRLPSAGALSFGLPGDAVFRLTVWDTPRGALPDEVWEFSSIDFINASVVALSRNLVDEIRNEDVTAVSMVIADIKRNLGAADVSLVFATDVDGLVPLNHAMSLAVPPERSSSDNRTDLGELTISVNPTAVELVSLMLTLGFDANAGGRGEPPLHYAIDNLRYDGDHGDSYKHQHGIIIEEQAAIVSLLLDAGADPTAGNHDTRPGAEDNTNYAIHRVAQRWYFGMLPVMHELLRNSPGRILPDVKGEADPLNDINSKGHDSPVETVLDRFIGHRTFGKHWGNDSYDKRLAAFRSVVEKIKDLGGACGADNINKVNKDKIEELCE